MEEFTRVINKNSDLNFKPYKLISLFNFDHKYAYNCIIECLNLTCTTLKF